MSLQSLRHPSQIDALAPLSTLFTLGSASPQKEQMGDAPCVPAGADDGRASFSVYAATHEKQMYSLGPATTRSLATPASSQNEQEGEECDCVIEGSTSYGILSI